MDVIFRLRFLLWVFVLGLWGALAFEFLQDELGYQPPRLTTLRTPFENEGLQGEVKASPGPLPTPVTRTPPPQAMLPVPPVSLPLPTPPSTQPTEKLSTSVALVTKPPSLPRPPSTATPHGKTYQHREPTHEAPPADGPKAPAGFETARTAHFIVFSQGEAVDQQFLETIEDLHSNLMLDLAAFAPWARTERVTLYLFQTQKGYQKFTGRPAWSGGSSSVDKRTLYVYKSSELTGIMAHELTHIYFDSFFAGGKADPLWLSEGMATFIQIQRGLAAPNWIRPNLDRLVDGKGYPLKEMMEVTNLGGVSDGSVRLWYTQSYSVVRFLIRSKWFVSYYQFCKNLRDGKPMNEALYRAYGMPYNRLSAVEHAWRYDLKTREISSLAMSQTTTSE